MKKYLFLITLLVSSNSFAQDFITRLNGFQLGQFRDVAGNELGDIFMKDTLEDGVEYEIYLVEPDSSVYMIFYYHPINLDVIWGIQLTSYLDGFDPDFKSIKMGTKGENIVKSLGKPLTIEDAGEYGQLWVYDQSNYTIEISPDNELFSIKILDYSDEFFSDITASSKPTFKGIKDLLNSSDREFIASQLSSDFELRKDQKYYNFNYSIGTEVRDDRSEIFSFLADFYSSVFVNISPDNSNQYEENIRLILGQNPMHVVKIQYKEKSYELVFKYQFGKYQLYELYELD